MGSGSHKHRTISSANRDDLTSFPIGILFVSFSYLIVVALPFSIVLNRSKKSRCLVLVQILEEMFSVFSHLV